MEKYIWPANVAISRPKWRGVRRNGHLRRLMEKWWTCFCDKDGDQFFSRKLNPLKKECFCEVSWNIIFFSKTMIVSLSPQEPSVAQWERVYYDVMIRRSYIIIVVWLLSGESSFFRLFCLWFFFPFAQERILLV